MLCFLREVEQIRRERIRVTVGSTQFRVHIKFENLRDFIFEKINVVKLQV